MAKISEHQECVEFLRWAHIRRIPYADRIVHNCNEGKMSKAAGARLNAAGRRKGFPDLVYPVPTRRYPSLYIELKTASGRLTKDQQDWLEFLTMVGNKAVVAVGWQGAARVMLDYLGREGEEI